MMQSNFDTRQPGQSQDGLATINDAPLYALVIKLVAAETVRLPLAHGDWLNAAFYNAIAATQPELARQVHDLKGRKGFTLSAIQGLPDARGGDGVRIFGGHRSWFRLTVQNGQLLEAFIQRLLTVANVELQVGPGRFIIEQVMGTPGSDEWAGYTTTETLRREVQPRPEIRLHFLSPTTFSRHERAENGRNRYCVLPDPTLIWSGLRGAWKQITGGVIDPDFEGWVERNVVVSKVNHWQTVLMQLHKSPLAGGIGDVTFRCLMPEHPWLATWCWLADLAFYSGVGYKTTQGMGQCRVVRVTPARAGT